MPPSTGLLTAVSSHVASLLPDRVVAGAVRAVYPRIEPELARLADFMPAGGTALDVGAWYGPWTQRMRKIADQIVAIEPNEVLAQSISNAFPDVRVIRAAASDHEGSAELFLPKDGPAVGTSSLERGDGSSATVTVPLVTIDGLGLNEVRFLKIDVEGHELSALRGAAETIHRDGPVLLIEVEDRIQPVAPIIDLLAEWGYRGYVLPEREWLPLADFDIRSKQRDAIARVTQSLARRVVLPRPRYVNSVLFKRDGN